MKDLGLGRREIAAWVLGAALAAGCSASRGANGSGAPSGGGTDGGTDTPILPDFAAKALAIAGEYQSWGRVDDEWRWAPFLCRLPYPGIARPSASNDPSTHGQKLYSVFVKHHENYPAGSQVDQAVVKQSWTAELVTLPDGGFQPEAYRPGADDSGDHFYPYAQGDGGLYRASAPAGLFIMFKLDAATPETDEGWVYATVSTANQVTSAGRVDSCMGCHEMASHDRLFGVPTSALQP